MIWTPTAIAGVLTGTPEIMEDERGWFTRVYCRQALADAGIDFVPSQISVSHNHCAGTVRGMHYQLPPAEERKLIRCIAGRVYDVVVDVRRTSSTHQRWVAVELDVDTGNALFVPAGVAHGFFALSDHARLEYMIDVPYAAEHAHGVRWNDPALAISWPGEPAVISERDRAWPDYGG
ncbi:MAG: dTDP-4-dehydrorhamnose 3,5-epimerase family protein [Rhodospirillales bacterium]|nr:dTDP-4-dehydrorhamnose 3,5-epimerase family protein [Rhodospirillales bacterium]